MLFYKLFKKVQEDFSKEPHGDQFSEEILAKYAVSPVNVGGRGAEGKVVVVFGEGWSG